MTILRKTLMTTGLVALVCLVFALAPAGSWAQDDTDRDGLGDQLESEGFVLYEGYDLWDSASETWIEPEDDYQGIPIPGANACTGTDGGHCLNLSKPDLFVIWYGGINIDLASCDLFALGTKPVADGGLGFNIWVLKRNGGLVPDSPDRVFTQLSSQKAVVLYESLETNVNVTGWSQYATIMEPGKGLAVIYSQKIINDMASSAQSSTGLSGPDLHCLHFQNTAIHEILHVAWALDNNLKNVYSHHITRGEYIMQPAIIYTEKKGLITYYIPEVASSATQETWSFGSYLH